MKHYIYPGLAILLAIFVLSLGITWGFSGKAIVGPALTVVASLVMVYSASRSLTRVIYREISGINKETK